MRAVVQRVSQASVTVDEQVVGAIEEPGLVVLVGVTHTDTPELAAKLAAKLWHLRILDGEKSCSDVAAPLLVIRQFTLYADTRKGRRPSWLAAAPGPVAGPVVDAVVCALRELGAHMNRQDRPVRGQRRRRRSDITTGHIGGSVRIASIEAARPKLGAAVRREVA